MAHFFQFLLKKRLYMDTHCVMAVQSYTAIQRDTTLYNLQLYIAIHYFIQPLYNTVRNTQHPPLGARARGAARARRGRARERARHKKRRSNTTNLAASSSNSALVNLRKWYFTSHVSRGAARSCWRDTRTALRQRSRLPRRHARHNASLSRQRLLAKAARPQPAVGEVDDDRF